MLELAHLTNKQRDFVWFYLSETDRINRASLQLFQENKGILVFKVKTGTHIFSLKGKKSQFSNKNHPCLTIQLTCQYCFSPRGLKCQSTVARADTSSLFLQEIHFRENPSPATASVRESTSEHPPWHWETTEYRSENVSVIFRNVYLGKWICNGFQQSSTVSIIVMDSGFFKRVSSNASVNLKRKALLVPKCFFVVVV